MYDLNKIVCKMKDDLNLSEVDFPKEYFYNSLSLCLIDAVFSIGVSYTSTENTVERYCNFYKIKRFRSMTDKNFPNHKDQDTIENLIDRIETLSIPKFTEQVFNNRQRTSTKSGILKTEAVLMIAKILLRSGISSFKDIEKLFNSETIENSIKTIPGQKSGVSFEYFLMLSGSKNHIKPDRMIIRYIEKIVESKLKPKVIIQIIQDTAKVIKKEFPNINPRSLDYKIWNYQRNQNDKITKEIKIKKLSIEVFKKLKNKYGHYSSWAVWEEQTDKPKSNMEDLSIFENEEILETLNPEIILVALNFSVDKEIKTWENFHGKNGEVYKLRYALKNTPLWGAYMTDIIVGHVDPSANSMMRYLKDHPDLVIENIKRFENEINDLNVVNPILYALGNDVFEILNNNLSDKYTIKQIPHYASRISKEIYKDKVWKQLKLKV